MEKIKEVLEKIENIRNNNEINWDAPSLTNKSITNRVAFKIFEGALTSIFEKHNNPYIGFGADKIKAAEELTIKNFYKTFREYL